MYKRQYHDGVAKLLIPAPLDDSEIAEMQKLAIAAYRALQSKGSRVRTSSMNPKAAVGSSTN